ncbi:hypothetical protein JHK84_055304 [Glycine max]|nr:hypothetical protein JHK84_055304 [Glycine max]
MAYIDNIYCQWEKISCFWLWLSISIIIVYNFERRVLVLSFFNYDFLLRL